MGKKELTVIIPAAGAGKRLGAGMNKAFVKLKGVPLFIRCLHMLAGTGLVREAIVVVAQGEEKEAAELKEKFGGPGLKNLPVRFVTGGAERADSVLNALETIRCDSGYVAVHDGARPFAGREIFERALSAAKRYGAAIAAVHVKDTIKVVDDNGCVVRTLSRDALAAIQTPQIFEVNLLRRAYEFYRKEHLPVTDDASLVEALGETVAVVDGDYANIKVTTPEDLVLAGQIIEKRDMANGAR